MQFIARFQQQVEEEIGKLLFGGQPRSLYEPISYILSLGGKRIRPVMTLMGCALFQDDVKRALNPALALEIFHNFTLVHDDLMDHANLRRGKETVHKKWSESTAILSGDAMLVIAYEKLVEGMEPAVIPQAMQLFSTSARKVCEGQEWDMLFESRQDVTIDEYVTMIGLKTAALLAGCLQMGALVAGADKKEQALLYDFGYTLGTAFQIQDDILDAYGSENDFGKKIGGDIAANKKTYLTLKTLELAAGEDKALLSQLFTQKPADNSGKISQVMAIYEKYGVKAFAENARDEFFSRAIDDLEHIRGNAEVKAELKALAENLVIRNK
jgi:geranylgeranyl diphosphate synthase type II